MNTTGREDRGPPLHDLAQAVLRAVATEDPGAARFEVVRRDRRCDEVDELHLADGRVLIVKRAIAHAADVSYAAARLAARLLEERARLVVPEYLAMPEATDGDVLAYWRVPCATVAEAWSGTPRTGRDALLESWGRLVRAVHRVRLPGHGPLTEAVERPRRLVDHIQTELDSLVSRIAGTWPAGLAPAREALGAAAAAVGDPEPDVVLVHGDLFAHTLLCRREARSARCVGVVDLERAFGGPAEADFAKTEVLHGPLLGTSWSGDWLERVRAAYGRPLRSTLVEWYRCRHLLFAGYLAAATRQETNAIRLARAAAAELDALGSGRSHADIVLERLAA